MFCLQSQNQVLYHLTQFASTVTSKPTPFCTKTRNQNDQQITRHPKNEGSDRSVPLANNYSQFILENLGKQSLRATVRMKSNNAQIVLDKFSVEVSRRGLANNRKWNVSSSYLAKDKHSFPCAALTEPIVAPMIRLLVKQQHKTLCTLYVKNPVTGYTQMRHFKTERNLRGEKENSALSKWLKKFQEEAFWSNKTTKTVEMDVDKLKMLSDSSENTEEKKKIKTAFLDGFETGLGRRKNRFGFVSWTLSCIVVAFILAQYIGSWEQLTFTNNRDFRAEIVEVTFDDCKGVQTAKNELMEIVSYLKNPEKYITMGGKLPKGVLLVGVPGTGKTLLARAVAGEAGVPFFYASGAEFDDIFVGQGARRVKHLFKAAKQKQPAVIFIDEIDSVGRKRTSSVVQPYANQTINQLLAEMDGFVRNEGIIVLGATNKRDMLDSALVRPGRFDVQIYIDKPDYIGRKEIISHYLGKVIHRDIDVDLLARKTTGFTGSAIENLINQAALKAAANNADYVTMEHLDYARDKVTIGLERHVELDEERNRSIAYHEAGHALVAYFTENSNPIHKITIIPQGQSLGHVSYIPEKDEVLLTKAQLKANIDVALGGRIAEELTFGLNAITTGASSDLQKANEVAEGMVRRLGMSEKVGLRIDSGEKGAVAMSTTDMMDTEIKHMLNESCERVRALLTKHSKELKLLAETLLKYETLTGEEVTQLLSDKRISGEDSKTVLTDKASVSEPGKIIPPLVQSAKNIL